MLGLKIVEKNQKFTSVKFALIKHCKSFVNLHVHETCAIIQFLQHVPSIHGIHSRLVGFWSFLSSCSSSVRSCYLFSWSINDFVTEPG